LQSTKFPLQFRTPHTNTSSIEKPKEICPLKNPKTTDVRLCGHKLRYSRLYQISTFPSIKIFTRFAIFFGKIV